MASSWREAYVCGTSKVNPGEFS